MNPIIIQMLAKERQQNLLDEARGRRMITPLQRRRPRIMLDIQAREKHRNLPQQTLRRREQPSRSKPRQEMYRQLLASLGNFLIRIGLKLKQRYGSAEWIETKKTERSCC